MVIGDGPLLGNLKEQCRQHGIAKNVVFTGHHANIPLVQSIIDIQVFPSLWEGTPLTLFEAMSMKLPIVSTTVDGLGEILRQEENALLVPQKDSGRLASAIEDLLINKEKARQLAAKAYVVSKDYDIQRSVENIQRIYDELV